MEWEPASIEHFSVPADSTPQSEIVPEILIAVPLPDDLFIVPEDPGLQPDNVADFPPAVHPPTEQAAPTYFGPGTRAQPLPTTGTKTS